MNIRKIVVPFLVALLSLWVVSPFVLAQIADKDADAVKIVPKKRGGVNKPPAKRSTKKNEALKIVSGETAKASGGKKRRSPRKRRPRKRQIREAASESPS